MPVTAPIGLQKIRNEFLGTSTVNYDSGSATITAPANATAVTIKLWGGGGYGGTGGGFGSGAEYGGGGGGGGAYCEYSNLSVTGGSTQFNYVVGAGGLSPLYGPSSGTASTVTGPPGLNLSAGAGANGQNATISGGGTPGVGGSASGGTINQSGTNGQIAFVLTRGGNGGGSPNGGSGGLGVDSDVGGSGNFPGGGGAGGGATENSGSPGGNGAGGRVQFIWTTLGATNFAAYVRGGSYVPNIAANSAISTTVSGLAMSQFLNASRIRVLLPGWNSGGGYDNNIGASYVDTTCSGADATAYLYVSSNGTMWYEGGLGPQGVFAWLQSGSASDYYFRFDVTSGDTPTGILSTNLQMNTNYSFSLYSGFAACGDAAGKASYGTWSFRDSSNNIIVSQTFSMTADASSSD